MAWVIAVASALLAIGARWYFVTHAQVYQPLDRAGYWGDAQEYYWYAWNLVHHGVFSQDFGGALHPVIADSYRDPGYPVFLALFMALTGSFEEWYASVLLSHVVLGGITVACIILALRRTLPWWMLTLVGAGLALWPHSVSITAYVFTENLSAPLWAAAVLAIREASVRNSLPWTIAAALALAAAGLTNSVLAPLVLPLAAMLGWKRLLPTRLVAILVILVVITMGAWAIRNASVTTGPSSAHRIAMNLVQGSWPTYHMAAQLDARHVEAGTATMRAIGNEITAFDASPAAGWQMMWQRISRSPGTHLAWYLSKPALLWGWQVGLGAGDIYVAPTRNSPYVTQPFWRGMEAVAFSLNYVIALLALGGVGVALWQRGCDPSLLVLAVTVTWVTLVYGALQSDSRYSIPFRGAELALAAGFVVNAIRYRRQRHAALHARPENEV